jgi:hypothetical protein
MPGKRYGSIGSEVRFQILSNGVAELPINRNIRMEIESKKRLYARTKTLSIFISMFSSLVRKFEFEYWVTHCGTDGYLYLLFQRMFLKLTI